MKAEATSLLRIDFDAAIDKLAGAQLQGTWQLPAELARLAIATGARSVAFDIEPRHLAMTAAGARWDQRMVADFASVLDRRLEAADRHEAMVELEARGAFALSAVACSSLRSLVLRTGSESGLKLELMASGELAVARVSESAIAQQDIGLTVEGLAIDAERATAWLRRAGRFSPVPITIDGARIPHGFRGSLIEKRLEVRARTAMPRVSPSGGTEFAPAVPLATLLSIARRGGTPRLWLLRHGIIATHATVPGYPAFEAAVEMAAPQETPGPDPEPRQSSAPEAPRVTGAALRERLGPYLESLVDASVDLMIELGSTLALAEPNRARVGRLLLRSALKRRRLSQVSGVRIFPLLNAEGKKLVSIDLIGRLVRVEDGGVIALDAVPPEEDPKRYAVADRGALAISQGERALLGELLSVVFSRPPVRARQGLRGRLLELATERLSTLRWARGAPIDSSELTAAERGLLSKLAVAAPSVAAGAEFRTGHGKVQRDSEGKLLLPRDNAAVRACVRAVERDPVWFYPATITLFDGRDQGPDLTGADARRQWYATLDRT